MRVFETQWNLDLTVQFAEWTLLLLNAHETSNYIIPDDVAIWANNVYCHKWCNTCWKLQASFWLSWMENSPLIGRKSREKLTHYTWTVSTKLRFHCISGKYNLFFRIENNQCRKIPFFIAGRIRWALPHEKAVLESRVIFLFVTG